jgi:hypothetical protein
MVVLAFCIERQREVKDRKRGPVQSGGALLVGVAVSSHSSTRPVGGLPAFHQGIGVTGQTPHRE